MPYSAPINKTYLQSKLINFLVTVEAIFANIRVTPIFAAFICIRCSCGVQVVDVVVVVYDVGVDAVVVVVVADVNDIGDVVVDVDIVGSVVIAV